MNKYFLLFGFLVLGSFISCKNNVFKGLHDDFAFDYESEKVITADSAAVATAHPLASAIGKDILKQGGNAIDASIAVQYALAVVFPIAGNIGGGGFMVVHTADGESNSIDYRERAPGSADRDMYLDENGVVIPRKSLDGHLAAGVPGTVAGTYLVHQKYGKLPMDQLISPAIDLAEKGFAITQQEADKLNESADKFKELNTKTPGFVKNRAWKKGDTLIQQDLAKTLLRISDNGKDEFYQGQTAELIVEEMERGEGIISLDDLKNYEPVEREPRKFPYKNHDVITMDLPSSGGLMLEMMLQMLEPYDLKEMGYQSPEAINHIVEVERRAYADRTDYMGDPDFVDVPTDLLVDKDYLKSRMDDFEPGKAGVSKEIEPGLMEAAETTHLSILDKEGNAVSVTTTLNTNYGSKVVVGNAGFFLNNEMDDFSAKPGEPNAYGLMGTEANKIEAEKRPVSSMMPTIILKDKKPYMVVGTPGGSTIITSVLQSVLNVMEFGLDADHAVNDPKFHHQWQPDSIIVEQDYPKDVRLDLEDMGYSIDEIESIGRTELILVENDTIHAVADKRGDDSASGY